MRKMLSVLFTATVLALPLHAQTGFGVLGGFVSSNITSSSNDGTFSSTSRTGFAVGISMAGMLSPDVSLGPEALYIEKGAQVTSGGNTAALKLGYVEVPVLLKVGFGDRDTKLFILGGPAIAFKVACTNELSGTVSGSSDCGSGEDNDIKSTDFSIMFGAGVIVNQISISARYDLGLTDISSTANDSDPNFRNHAFLILAGIHFGPMHHHD